MALTPVETAAIERATAGRPPAGVVLDVMFTNGLSALRALVALGVPAIAVDHRRSALGLHARGVVPVLAPDPAVDETGYLEVLAEVARLAGPRSVAFPTQDIGLVLVAREAARLHGLALSGSGWDVIGPLLAKRAQIEAARRAGVPVPPTWFADDRAAAEHAAADLRYPAIVKPSVGIAFKAREGRPVLEAGGPDELLAAWERAHAAGDDLLLQEVVPGGDDALWTVGSFTSGGGTVLSGTFSGRKLAQMPPRFGTCRVGEARWSDEAVALAQRLLETVGYDGVAQTEFKQDPRDGSFRLMELNTRLWQWHSLARRCGVDLVAMAYRHALGEPVATAASGPRHDGKRWVPVVPSWRSGRAHGESRLHLARQAAGVDEEPILSLRDPVPGMRLLAGTVAGAVKRRRPR